MAKDGKKECPDCYRSDLGSYFRKGNGRCSYCRGTGERLELGDAPAAIIMNNDRLCVCSYCSGTGQCNTCGGSGFEYYETHPYYDDDDDDDDDSYASGGSVPSTNKSQIIFTDQSMDYGSVRTPSSATGNSNAKSGGFNGAVLLFVLMIILALFILWGAIKLLVFLHDLFQVDVP